MTCYRVWINKGCHVQIARVWHDGAPDDLPATIAETIGPGWELHVAQPLTRRDETGGQSNE